MNIRFSWALLLVLFSASLAIAYPAPNKVKTADAKKTKSYLSDGVFVGGDRVIDSVVVKDIRRAPNAGFERIVVDLEGSAKSSGPAISRPPYYQVSVDSQDRRVIFTVFGQPRLGFEATKILKAFSKSGVVSSMQLYPKLDESSWTFAMTLKKGMSVEVFELSSPARVIMDVKSAMAADVGASHTETSHE